MAPLTRSSTTRSPYADYIEEAFASTPLDSIGALIEQDQDIDSELQKPSYSSLGKIFSHGVTRSYNQAAPQALFTSCAILSASLNTWVYCVALAVNSVCRIAHYDRLYNALKGIFIKHSERASTNRRLLTKIKEVAIKIFLSPLLVISAIILTLVSVITIALGAVISVLVPAISPVFLALFATQSLLTVVGNAFTTAREVYSYIRDAWGVRRGDLVPDVNSESSSQDEQRTAEISQSVFRKIAASISGAVTAVFLMPIQLCLSLPSVAIPPVFGALLTPVLLMSSLFNISSLNQIFYGMSTLINPKKTIKFDGKELHVEDVDEVGLILKLQAISPSALRNLYRELRATGIEKEFFTQTSRYAKHLDALKAEVEQLKFAATDTTAALERAAKVYEENAALVAELEEALGFIHAEENSVQQSNANPELLKAGAKLSASEKKLSELQTRRSYLEYKIFKAELRMFSISSAIAVVRKNLWDSAFLTAREKVSALVPSVESAILKSIVAANNVTLAKSQLVEAELNVDKARQSLAHAQSKFYESKFKTRGETQQGEVGSPAGQQEAAGSSAGEATNVASGQHAQAEQDLNRAKEHLDACLVDLKAAKKNAITAEARKLVEEAAEGRVIARYSTALLRRDKIGVALEESRIEEYKNKTHMYNLIEVRNVRDIPGIQQSKIPITEREKGFIKEYLELSSEKISAAHAVISELKSRLEYPTYYESVVLAHRKNLLLREGDVSITREDAENPETASILDARLILLPSVSADYKLKSAEAYYRNSLKKLSDIDARGTSDDRLHTWSPKMARMEVADSKALYDLSLREKNLVSAREKVEQCTKHYDASVMIAANRSSIASAAAHDLDLLLSAAPENKKEISIASERLRIAKEEEGEAKSVVTANAELLKEAKSALNSVESAIYDAKRAYLEASHALKSTMIEGGKTSPEHVLSEKEEYALREAQVLSSDTHREQTISDICTFLCAPYERDTSFSLVPGEKIYETCSDIIGSIQKKRLDMYNAHKQAHDSEKRFLFYVYNKVDNDLSHTESLAKLARESGEARDGVEGYEEIIASLKDLNYSARIAVSAMQVLSDRISSSHDIHSYQLTTQRMIPAAYAEIARIRSAEVPAEKDSAGEYEVAHHESTNKIAKLSRLAARHSSAAVEECILRYKYENTDQLKAFASSRVKRISAIDLVNANRAKAPSATLDDIRACSESLHESAYLLYDVTNLIGGSCSFSDNITDTVEGVCKKLCKASEALHRAKTLLENASRDEERDAAQAVYDDAVRQMALQTAYHDKVISECNVAASLARVLSAAQNVNSAKKAFARYENNGIKDLLIKRAEAEFNMANAHFCIVQLAHKTKSAKLHLVSSSVDLDKANDQHKAAEKAVSELRERVISLDCDPTTDGEELEAAITTLASAIQSEALAKASVVRAQEIKEDAALLLKDTDMQYAVIHARSNAVIAKAEELNDHIVGMIKNKILRSSNPALSRELKSILNSQHGGTNTSSELEHTLQHADEENAAEDELKFLEASLRGASALQYLIMSETEVLYRMKSLELLAKLHEPIVGEQHIDDTIQRNALELARLKLAHATACSEAAKAHSVFLNSLSELYNATCDEKRVRDNTSSSAAERNAASAIVEGAKQQVDIDKILLDIEEAKKDITSASLECGITSEIVRKVAEQGDTVGRYRTPAGSGVDISDILKKYKNEHHNAQLRKELATLKHELAQTSFIIHRVEKERDGAKSELSSLRKSTKVSRTRFDLQCKIVDATANLNSLKEKSRALQEKIGEMATKVRARDGILDIIENVGITRSTQNAYSYFPFRSFREFSVFTSDKIFVTTKEDIQLFSGREAAEDIQQGTGIAAEKQDEVQKVVSAGHSGQVAASNANTSEKHAKTELTLESTPGSQQNIAQHVDLEKLGKNLRLVTARKNLEYWNNEVTCKNSDVHGAYLDYVSSKISIDRASSLPVYHQHIDDENHLGILQNFAIWQTAKTDLAMALAERNVTSKDVELAAIARELGDARSSYQVVCADSSSSATEKKSAQELVESGEKRLKLAKSSKKVALAELKETVAKINLKNAELAHKYVFGKKLRTPTEERYAKLALGSAEKELKLTKESKIIASSRFALLSANFHKYNVLKSLHAAEDRHEYVKQNPSLHTDKDREEAATAVIEATRLVDDANKKIDTARAELREARMFDDKLESSERDLKLMQTEQSLIECKNSIKAFTAELEKVKNENKRGEQSIPPSIEAKICYIERRLDALLCEESYIISEINLLQTLAALDDLKAFNKYAQKSSSYTAKERSSAETLLNRKELEVELAKAQKEIAEAKLEIAHMQLSTQEVMTRLAAGEPSYEGELHTKALEETIAKHDEDIALSKLEILNAEKKLLRTTMHKHEMERVRKCIYESKSCTARERMLADRDLQLADNYTEFSITEKSIAKAKLAVLEATREVAVAEERKRYAYEDTSCTVSEKKAANTLLCNAINALRKATLAENIAQSEQNLLRYELPSDNTPELELQDRFSGDISTTAYVKVVDLVFLQRATSEYLKLELLCLQEAAARGKPGIYSVDDARKDLVKSTNAKIVSVDKKLVDVERELKTLGKNTEPSGIQSFETQLAVARRDLVKAEKEQATSYLQVVKDFENLSKVCEHHKITGGDVDLFEGGNVSVHEDGKKALNAFKISLGYREIMDAKLDITKARIAVIEASKHLEEAKKSAAGEILLLKQEGESHVNKIKAAETKLRIAEATESVARAREGAAIARLETINNSLFGSKDSLDAAAGAMKLSEAEVGVARARLNTIIAYETCSELESGYTSREKDISTVSKVYEAELESVTRSETKLVDAVVREQLAEKALKDTIASQKEKASASHDIESATMGSKVLESGQNRDSGEEALVSTTSLVKNPEEDLQLITGQIPILFSSVSRIGEGVNKITDADISKALGDIANRRSLVLLAIRNREDLEQQRQLILKNEASTAEERISIDKSLEDANAALEFARESRNLAEIKLGILKAAKTLKIVKDKKRASAYKYDLEIGDEEHATISDIDALKIAILRANAVVSKLEVAKINKELADLTHVKGNIDPGTKSEISELCKKAVEADLALFATTKDYRKISDDLIHSMQKADTEGVARLAKSLEHAEKALETAEQKKASVDSAITLLSAGKATPSAKGGTELKSAGETTTKERFKDVDLEKQLESAKLHKEAADANLALFYATQAYSEAMGEKKHVEKAASELTEEQRRSKSELEIAEARKAAIDSAITLLNEHKALEEAKYNLELIRAGIRIHCDEAQAQQELDSRTENAKFAEASRNAFYARYEVLKSSVELASSKSNYELVSRNLDGVRENADEAFGGLRNAKYEFEINKQKTRVADAELAILNAMVNLKKSSDNSESKEEESKAAQVVHGADQTLQFLKSKRAVAKAELMVLEAAYYLAVMEGKYIVEHKSSSTFEEKSATYALLLKATKDLQIAKATRNFEIAELAVLSATMKLKKATSSASPDLETQEAQHALELAKTDKDVATNARLNAICGMKKLEIASVYSQQTATEHVDSENGATAHNFPSLQFTSPNCEQGLIDISDRGFPSGAPSEIGRDIVMDFFEDNEEREYVRVHQAVATAKAAVSHALQELENAQQQETEGAQGELSASCEHNLRFAELQKSVAEAELQLFSSTVAFKRAVAHDKFMNTNGLSTSEGKRVSADALSDSRKNQQVASYNRAIAEAKLEVFNAGTCLTDAERYYEHVKDIYKNSHITNINLVTAFSEVNDASHRLKLAQAREAAIKAELELFTVTNEFDSILKQHEYITGSNKTGNRSPDDEKLLGDAKRKLQNATKAKTAADEVLFNIVRESRTQDKQYAMTVGVLEYADESDELLSCSGDELLSCSNESDSFHTCVSGNEAMVEEDTSETVTSKCFDVKVERVAPSSAIEHGQGTPSKN